MTENDRFSGCLDEIKLEFVEREVTPWLLMKLSIQLYLVELSLSNTVLFPEVFGVDRVRTTVHNWVNKADLQPESGRSPNEVVVDETVIRPDDEQYWLYAAVDPETNNPLYTQLELIRNNATVDQFFADPCEKHDVDNAIIPVDGAAPLQRACRKHDLDFRYDRHRNWHSVERVFRELKRRNFPFLKLFNNAHTGTTNNWLRSFAFAWNQLI